MPKSDWKEPFLHFRDQIRPHFDAGIRLYHEILMSPFYEGHELNEVVENQAAAEMGRPLVLTIETPTEDCKYHAHYFYGDDSTCSLFGQALSGIDEWILGTPKGLLPQFSVPCNRHAPYKNLVTWANLVCYLAWEIDAPYLQATVEFQNRLHEVTSVVWSESPWPQSCDPRPVLIHQGNHRGQFTKFLETFSEPEKGPWCPDIIGAYLLGEPFCGDFIEASLAAIDVLVFMLEQVHGQKPATQNELSSSIKKRRRPNGRRKVETEVIYLVNFLRQYHDPEITGVKANTPLTAEQIAEKLGWVSDSGKPLQPKVSRRMVEFLGPNAMKKYQRGFVQGKITPGFYRALQDGGFDLEAIDNWDEDENSEDGDFD